MVAFVYCFVAHLVEPLHPSRSQSLVVNNSGLQVTDLTVLGWSKIPWGADGAREEYTPNSNGLQRHLYRSLRMGLNTRGLSLAGSSDFFQSSIQRKTPAMGAQPYARLLSTHVNVVNLA